MKFSIRSVTTALALGAMASVVHATDYSSWARYRPVTLNTTGMGLTSAVTNVPIALRFKASAHKDMLDSASTQVQANGSDIRVTKADGTTDVPFEIEHLSTGPEGRLHIWVLADNVPANSASAGAYRVYWGKAGQTSMSNPAATFPTSAGYQAVFHLNDTGATIANAANSSINGTATGTVVSASALGGQSSNIAVTPRSGGRIRTFGTSTGGSSNETEVLDYIRFNPGTTHALSNISTGLTMEGWVFSSIFSSGNSSQGTKHLIAHGAGNSGTTSWLARTAGLDGTTGQNHYSAGGANNINGPIAPWGEQNNWHYVVSVWNGTTWTIYRQRESNAWNNPVVDGPPGMLPDSAGYKIIAGNGPTASTNPWFIGAASNDGIGGGMSRGWQGYMDEVRISNVARDSNYVKLSFMTTRADTLAGVIHPVSVGPTEVTNVSSAYTAWTGHRPIVLNTSASGANVAANVTNFPVLIRLGAAEGDIIAAANGGNSIRFSKADDMTALPYEIESWSSTAAAIWVKVDTIKGNNATQTIRMHWGNAAAPAQSNGAAVFDSTGGAFTGVWHMNGTSGELDATGNAYSAVATGTVPAVTGNVGGARQFNGTSTYLTVTNSAASKLSYPNTADFTLSAWIYADSISTSGNTDATNGHGIITKGNNQFALAIYGTSNGNRFYEIMGKGNGTWNQVPTNATGDTLRAHTGAKSWQLVTGTWSGSTATDSGKIYVNGRLYNTKGFGDMSASGRTETFNVVLGGLGGGTAPGANITRPFHGRIDEVIMSGVLRDSNWIKLTYASQKEVNSLANIGLPVYTAPGLPTNVLVVADTAKIRVSWTAPANNGGKPITLYKATVVGDTLQACTSTTLTCNLPTTPGDSVNIVVKAINEVGVGANSTASSRVAAIAPIVPTAPLTPSAVTNSSSAVTVTWAAPSYNGGSAIIGYTVTSNPGALTCTTTGELTCQVAGLNQGTVYGFTVTATNAAGSSPSSASASATTTALLPGAFVIQMDGARHPFTYRLPTNVVAMTEKLTMSITDVQGKKIWSRTVNPAATKTSELTWNGVTSKGLAVAPGLYVVKITALMDGKTIESIQKAVKQ